MRVAGEEQRVLTVPLFLVSAEQRRVFQKCAVYLLHGYNKTPTRERTLLRVRCAESENSRKIHAPGIFQLNKKLIEPWEYW